MTYNSIHTDAQARVRRRERGSERLLIMPPVLRARRLSGNRITEAGAAKLKAAAAKSGCTLWV